ncbi:MAG TPA: hypothetical protein VH683_11995 [Thermoleophilaceae bacterium]
MGFEVDRFEWTDDGRLELVGRWFGLRGHRFLRPTLDVDVAGERRRMLADLEHKPWAPEEGQDWTAAFTWRGEPGHFENAELTVAPDLAIQLPQPDNPREQAAAEEGERLPARPPRTAVLEGELAAALVEVQRLSDELAGAQEAQRAAEDDLREKLEAERTRARGLETAAAEARAHAGLELDELRSERDAAIEARDALEQQLKAADAERSVIAEQRDKARQERNAWMSKAHTAATGVPAKADTGAGEEPRAPAEADEPAIAEPPTVVEQPAAAEPAPEPEPEPATAPAQPSTERRTIQIGERPGPLAARPPLPTGRPIQPSFLAVWGPRLAALAVLLVLLAIVAVILTLAF